MTYPSSGSRPLFQNLYPLFETDPYGFTWNKFDDMNSIDTYNLKEVFIHFHFPRDVFTIGTKILNVIVMGEEFL